MIKYNGPRRFSPRHLACVTLQCNARCSYCYYAQKCDQYSHWPEMLSVEHGGVFRPLGDLKAELQFNVMHHGTTTQDLFGGEPTIHPQIVDYVKYSVQELGVETRVVSNGLMLANRKFFKAMHEAGCNSAMLTIHGDRETHDKIVGVPGAYTRMLRTYENCNEFGWPVMSNVIPLADNHDQLLHVVDYVTGLATRTLNMDVITFDSQMFERGECDHLVRPMREQAFLIKDIVDLIFSKGINYQITDGSESSTVRYVPFCLYKGYEHVVSGYHQLPYNHKEWSYNTYQPQWRGLLHTEEDYLQPADAAVSCHYFAPQCEECAVRRICVGVRHAVQDIPGNKDFQVPYPGEQTRDPWYFKERIWIPPTYRSV